MADDSTVPPGAVQRAQSEAFPPVPRALLQKKADSRHRPLKPSPLSTNSSTSPTASTFAIGEETKSAEDTEALKEALASKLNKLTSESESEAERKNQGDELDDDIAKLQRIMEKRMRDLLSLEKSLLETEQNVNRLVNLYGEETHSTIPKQRSDLLDDRRRLFQAARKVEKISAEIRKRRDEQIDAKTEKMVSKYVNEIELILRDIDDLAEELKANRGASFVMLARSIFWSFVSLFMVLLGLALLLLLFAEEEDVRWTLE